MDLAKKYEEDLERLKEEQLEQLENIKVAIKVREYNSLSLIFKQDGSFTFYYDS